MELLEIVVTVLAVSLSATFAYFYGATKAPRSKVWTDLKRDYEDTIEGLRKEKRRWQSVANWYKQGAVNQDTVDKSDAGDVIDSVISALPPNFRGFIEPFRGQAKQWAKEHPEEVEAMKNKVISKLSKKSDDGGNNGNSQQATEML